MLSDFTASSMELNSGWVTTLVLTVLGDHRAGRRREGKSPKDKRVRTWLLALAPRLAVCLSRSEPQFPCL